MSEPVTPAEQPAPPPEGALYLLTKEAAYVLRVSPRTLEAMRTRGGGPPFVTLGPRRIVYRVADLHAWAEARLRNSTARTQGEAA